mgnify:CR=1 FL=1
MPSDKQMKRIILWLIMIIFISFIAAVVLFILSGDTWFTSAWLDRPSLDPGSAQL